MRLSIQTVNMKKLKLFLPFLILAWQSSSAQTVKKEVAYGDDAKQKFDVYLPQQTKNKSKAIILIHGGSWIGGDKINMTHWLKPLQSAFPDDAIFTLNYRLASRQNLANAWPAQINDVDAAVSFIKNHAKAYNINKKKLILLGESAGAQLALVEGFNHDPNHDVKVVVDLFGPTDMADLYTAHREMAILMQGTPKKIPDVYADASVVNHVAKNSPATIIFHGTADPIVPIRESDSLSLNLKKAKVPSNYIKYQGKGHGWRGAEIQDTYNKTVAFIKEQLK